jgi:hypothetical protein
MHSKTLAAVGFAAALLAFGSAPASANANTSNDVVAGTAVRDSVAPSSYCGCGRGYVRYYRYYRVYPVVRVYRVYRVRYYI